MEAQFMCLGESLTLTLSLNKELLLLRFQIGFDRLRCAYNWHWVGSMKRHALHLWGHRGMSGGAPLPTIDTEKSVQIEALRLLRHRFGLNKLHHLWSSVTQRRLLDGLEAFRSHTLAANVEVFAVACA